MEAKPSKIIPENITMFHLEIVKSEIREAEESPRPVLNINVAHDLMHNLKDERVKLTLLIDLESEQKDEAKFEFDFHFKIKDLQNFYKMEEEEDEKDKLIFDGNFIATLLGISFSTARGVIYERLANTSLQGILLPVISPQKMLKSNTQRRN